MTDLLGDLRRAVGEEHVLTDPAVTAAHRVDYTGRYRAADAVVVRPADTAEVAAVVRACQAHGAAICPQGGNTGLVGGSVPLGGEIVVSTRRLQRLDPVDAAGASVVAGAGVSLADLQRHARDAGLVYGVDLGARDSATLGGTIATNAGGNTVIRYGMTRDQLLGVEAVLADGSVVGSLAGLRKDNTGYDLASLLCGSEGTLGIVTAACVRLHARAAHRVTALLGFADASTAIAALGTLRGHALPLEAVELMLAAGVQLVCDTFELDEPFPQRHPALLLVSCADAAPVLERLAAAVDDLTGLRASAVADDAAGAAALWRYRELHTDAVNGLGPPLKLDVTVPVGALDEVVHRLQAAAVDRPAGSTLHLFGHVGDGNLHVNVVAVPADREDEETRRVLELVLAHGGSISAEHGIGRLKKDWLRRQRSAADLAAFTAIRSALDPDGLLQPDLLC